jgi:hypothetical protein
MDETSSSGWPTKEVDRYTRGARQKQLAASARRNGNKDGTNDCPTPEIPKCPTFTNCLMVKQNGDGAQEWTTTIQSIQRLMEKWDNKSSHIIIMLSGAAVPP